MLKPDDVQGFDLAALTAALEDAALRQDRRRRQAESIGIPADCPETLRAAGDIDKDGATLAEASRFVATVRRFIEDEGHARPAAAVVPLRLVPAEWAPQRRNSLLARAFAVIVRPQGETAADRSKGAA